MRYSRVVVFIVVQWITAASDQYREKYNIGSTTVLKDNCSSAITMANATKYVTCTI